MPQPESIEAMLARLMPPAISEEGQRSLDAMLDELCGEEIEETPVVAAAAVEKSKILKFAAPIGIAAAVALAFALPIKPTSETPANQVAAVATPPVPEFVLIGESGRIEQTTDEGWVADDQGSTMQAVRVRVVEENTLRDEETGIVVQVSEPREELLLFPVSAF